MAKIGTTLKDARADAPPPGGTVVPAAAGATDGDGDGDADPGPAALPEVLRWRADADANGAVASVPPAHGDSGMWAKPAGTRRKPIKRLNVHASGWPKSAGA